MKTDVLIVGAGFAGSVLAERCASQGKSVLLIDKRNHLGGNAYDEYDGHGVLIHRFGPHIFHTNSQSVFDYLSRFTAWIPYEHRVLAQVENQLYPIPINQTTINQLYGLDLDEDEIKRFFERVRVVRDPIRTSEDVVLSGVGSDLCEKFFRGYTKKQWGLDLSELSAGVAARIPVRTNTDDRYFTDKFQNMPAEGYTRMFQRMIDHPYIHFEQGVDFQQIKSRVCAEITFYTGPIDEYYDFCYGKLPYRSLRFEHEHLAGKSCMQTVGTINYPNDHAYTRITEFKHLTGQQHTGTSVVREFPQSEGDPYYPIPRPENQALAAKYKAIAEKENNVFFVGRLAQYQYFNMDQVVGAALALANKIFRNEISVQLPHIQESKPAAGVQS